MGRAGTGTNGDPAANAFDDLAIAPDKQALLNGQKATFANYTSYSRGINGIMIDIANLAQPAGLSAADFEFRTGNSNNPASWPLLGVDPSLITVREGAGVDGSDRVTIIFPDGAVKKTWLQVTVKATEATGLATPDVHYWGNAIGETGNLTTNAYVDVSDSRGVRSNPHPSTLNPAPLDDKFDFNRDKLVNVQDDAFVRANPTNALTALKLIDLTGSGGAAEGEGEGGWWLVVGGWWLVGGVADEEESRELAVGSRLPGGVVSHAVVSEPVANLILGADDLTILPLASSREAGHMTERVSRLSGPQRSMSTVAWSGSAVGDQYLVGPLTRSDPAT